MIGLRRKHLAETDDQASAEAELIDRRIGADARPSAIIADEKAASGAVDR